MIVVYAEISSWVGISIGAKHCYLKMQWYDENIKSHSMKINNILTETRAKELNVAERTKYPELRGFAHMYKKGDKYGGFWTIPSALKMAKKVFKAKFNPNKDILMEEKRGTISIGKVIYCKNEILKKNL